MKVLVTGTEGYIGAVVPQLLMERGHEVIGVDAGFHRAGWLYGNSVPVWPKTLEKDIRLVDAADLDGIDAIVHMAELSNDPVGQLNPRITYDINHLGSLHLARLAKEKGIQRFVYTSSCSVYGIAEDDMVDETSPTNPQTTYAICKTLVERDVSELADDDFSPTFLRNATAFGASPRLRFDIVINNLSGLAWTTKEIRMDSDGTRGVHSCTSGTLPPQSPAPSRHRATSFTTRSSTSATRVRTTRCATSPRLSATCSPTAP